MIVSDTASGYFSRRYPWALDQGAHDVQPITRQVDSLDELALYCAPCGWSRKWSHIEVLRRGAGAIEAEVEAAIRDHIKPPPLTLDEMRDLGWFGEEA